MNLELAVGILYMTTQLLGVLIVSVFGFEYVLKKREIEAHAVEGVNGGKDIKVVVDTNKNEEFKSSEDKNSNKTTTTTDKKSFIMEWAATVWKIRSVYFSFIVHSFDIATDIMVVVQWWYEESNGNETDNVDTRLMAKFSIFVLGLHKLMSTLGIYSEQRNCRRALLQFFDLLIFLEIYNAHKKIMSNISPEKTENGTNNANKTKNKKTKNKKQT